MAVAASIVGGELYRARVLRDGAVGYWRLGDTVGAPTVADSSGNGYTGTVSGGVTLGQAGAIADGDTAALFDGSGKITVPALNPLNGATAVTIEGWVNHRGVAWSATQEMVQSWASTGHYLSVNSGALFGSLRISGAQHSLSSSAVPTSGWHHLAFTWSSGDALRLYLDGILQSATAAFTGTLSTAIGAQIASFDAAGSLFFNGSLDDVAVYLSALTARQVAEHYGLRLAVTSGLRVSGAATLRRGVTVVGTGGVRVGGAAAVARHVRVVGSGGVRVGGSAIANGWSALRPSDVVVQIGADDVVFQPSADDVVLQVGP